MSLSLRHGLYLGGFLIAYGLVFRLIDAHFTSPLGYVFYLALPAAVFLSLLRQRSHNQQTILQGGMRGAVVVLVGAFLYAAYVYGFNAFIDDSLIKDVRAAALAEFDVSAPDNAQQISRIEASTSPAGFAVWIFIQMLIAGLISTAVIAPFLRKRAAA